MATPPASNATPAPTSGLGSADIEALAFLVLMEASKSAQEDLKAIMESVQAINKQKEELRHAGNEARLAHSGVQKSDTPCTSPDCRALAERIRILAAQLPGKARFTVPPIATLGDLAAVEAKLKNSLDSLSELGETESLRLKMAMERRSKMMETLSNILKKMSESSDSIIANLK
jgi:hypothetical protein